MRPFTRLVGEMSTTNIITVCILFFINLINYMDRFTIAGVLEKVKDYYVMDNKQGGLLQTSFVVSYMIFAPIFGYLGDRYSRKYIMAGGVLFWSLTTYFGSLIPEDQKGWFFLMRGLVGVGEASYSTIAPTIIADLFVNEMRTRMLALFFFAIPVGSGLGYVVGSQMAKAFGKWQWALRVTPPLGIISVVFIMFVMKEPVRGEAEANPNDLSSSNTNDHQHQTLALHHHSILEDIRALSRNRSYIWSTLGFTCVCFAIGALSWWSSDYMQLAAKISQKDISLEKINLIFGAITAAAGIIGVVLGSGGASWYRRFNPRADPLICAAGIFISIPFSFLGLAVAHKTMSLAWISIFLAVLFLCINWTLVADILLYVVPADKRSFAQSMQILVAHLLGDAFSPFMVGAVSTIPPCLLIQSFTVIDDKGVTV
jgi:MFS family permease